MDVTRILSDIDAEIARLQQARAALTAISGSGAVAATKRRGRPKGSTNAPKAAKRTRNLSPEGRKRIQEAMKRRWAERRKQSAKKDSK
jgi:hypothetical protein